MLIYLYKKKIEVNNYIKGIVWQKNILNSHLKSILII